jgi:flagellar operon protein (TIGR03826 family)
MAELANCVNCDTVFVKNLRNICQKCYEEEERSFEIVYRFLLKRKNREARMADIVRATKVEEKLITKFIREKRLRISQFPMLAYKCDNCGTDITTGNICTNCSQQLIVDLEKHEKVVERRETMKLADEETGNVYFTYDKDDE